MLGQIREMPHLQIDLTMLDGHLVRAGGQIQSTLRLHVTAHRAKQLGIERKNFQCFHARGNLLVAKTGAAVERG